LQQQQQQQQHSPMTPPELSIWDFQSDSIAYFLSLFFPEQFQNQQFYTTIHSKEHFAMKNHDEQLADADREVAVVCSSSDSVVFKTML
jgi:hypothetical protein